jgi:vancomycin resistance protein VanW
VSRKSLWQVLDRRARVGALTAARYADWLARPGRYPTPRLAPTGEKEWPEVLGESVVPIAGDGHADPLLEAGKATNLALAAAAFDGLLIEADRPLSFWRTLGRTSAGRGYRPGRELRGGCVVPALGGGICLLSGALFALAARLGFTILERHGHSLEVMPPRAGQLWGLDATVFHPYVDLRFAPARGRVRLEVQVAHGDLRIAMRGEVPPQVRAQLVSVDERIEDAPDGRLRCNRLLRRLYAIETGALIEEAIIAVNRRRLVPERARGRTCLTCGEAGCWERPSLMGEAPW